jgi:hypothetical protein
MPAFFSTASKPLALTGKTTRICGYSQRRMPSFIDPIYSEISIQFPLIKEFLERGQEVSQTIGNSDCGTFFDVG